MKKKTKVRIKNLIKYLASFGVLVALTLLVLFFPNIFYQKTDEEKMQNVIVESFNYVDGFARDASAAEVLRMLFDNQYTKIITTEYSKDDAIEMVSKAINGFNNAYRANISFSDFLNKILRDIDYTEVGESSSYYAMEIIDGTMCRASLVKIVLHLGDDETLGLIINPKTYKIFGLFCYSPHYAFWDIWPKDFEMIFYNYWKTSIEKINSNSYLYNSIVILNTTLAQNEAYLNWHILN